MRPLLPLPIPGQRRALATALCAAAIGTLAAFASASAGAQQVVNPGDIIVERTVTPRSAFANVPTDQDPVAVRATTFPSNTFNPAIAQLATDADLTNAHGSSGIAPTGALTGGGMQAVTRILAGNGNGGNATMNAASIGAPTPGLGGQLSSSVSGALAPISNALSGAMGGIR